MPPHTTGPRPVPPKPNETLSDAIQYTTQNSSGLGYLVEAGKWLVGFFAALFRPARPR
jgi:hypothetical protein